jgi:hypothetical protein
MPDLTKLNFFSRYPIDKIVQQGEITIVNDGATNPNHQQAKVVTGSQTNNYGKTCLARARWSIDGGSNWQALEAELTYTYTLSSVSGDPGHPYTVRFSGLDSAISIGTSTSQVNFRTANGRHGNVTGATSPSYTPTSRTFLIQYVLYEKD